VGDLLELERTLQRDRQAYVATEVEEERPIVEALGNLLDRVVAVEEALHLLREVVDLVEDELDLARRQRVTHLRELQPDQEQQRDLRRERLRRRHTDLEPGARVD